jgi:hypothetical protein
MVEEVTQLKLVKGACLNPHELKKTMIVCRQWWLSLIINRMMCLWRLLITKCIRDVALKLSAQGSKNDKKIGKPVLVRSVQESVWPMRRIQIYEEIMDQLPMTGPRGIDTKVTNLFKKKEEDKGNKVDIVLLGIFCFVLFYCL